MGMVVTYQGLQADTGLTGNTVQTGTQPFPAFIVYNNDGQIRVHSLWYDNERIKINSKRLKQKTAGSATGRKYT
jgi:hypothetical protein